jgi:UDP-N-acetylglucosamine 2-epimerase
MNKKLVILGTRPEFIKLLPVISEIKNQCLEENFYYIFTGQHTDLVKDLFSLFSFSPSYIIQTSKNESLSHSFSYILSGIQNKIDEISKEHTIKSIIGLGDTTSCTCASLCAFFNQIPFAHIESGLRTNDLLNPFPEEFFRKLISLTSTIHFAPTLKAQENLLNEGVRKESILMTGNTIVDAIEIIKEKILNSNINLSRVKHFNKKNNILITCHRRENQNYKFKQLINIIRILSSENPELNFIWISHKNPYVEKEFRNTDFTENKNIYLLQPINIFELYYLYSRTKIIITDSGGIQEEAPSFDIPVIVIREKTERTESIDLGYSELAPLNNLDLLLAFNSLKHKKPVKMINPYGDGNAAMRIVSHLMTN